MSHRTAIVPDDAGWRIVIDERPVTTPAGAPLRTPTKALAEALAEEYAAQGGKPNWTNMPLARLANVALDGVAREADAVRAAVLKYAQSDLLCYRADQPETLVEAQRAAFDPVLDWAREHLGARFFLAEGIVFVAQPSESLEAVKRRLAEIQDPFALTALHIITSLTGSALLALALADGRFSAQEAWAIAHVDEDEQIKDWGADDEAVARRQNRWRDMAAAARTIDLLR